MTPLEQYIKEQLKNGYTSSQIKQYLIQQGYKPKDVETALGDLKKLSQTTTPKTTVQNVTRTPDAKETLKTQLTSYVLTYLQQGYGASQLFDYLKEKGYDENTLKKVFAKINKTYYQGELTFGSVKEHSLSSSSILKMGVMLVFVFLILGGGYFFAQNLLTNSNGSKLLDVEATPIKTKLVEGDSLGFNVDLISQGREGRIDVFFDYVIRDKTSKLILKEEDTKAFDTTLSFQKKISLPEMETGLYSLKVIAKYDGKIADSTFTFSYQATEEDKVPEIPEKPINEFENKEEKAQTKVEKPKSLDKKIISNPEGKLDQDLFNYAIGQDDKELALSYCEKIVVDKLKTECFYTVAQQSKDEETCDLINSIDRKEDCYMNFVMLGNYELCEDMTLSENNILCDQLIRLAKIKGFYKTEDDEGLKKYLQVVEYDRLSEEEVASKNLTLNDFSIKDVVN